MLEPVRLALVAWIIVTLVAMIIGRKRKSLKRPFIWAIAIVGIALGALLAVTIGLLAAAGQTSADKLAAGFVSAAAMVAAYVWFFRTEKDVNQSNVSMLLFFVSYILLRVYF